MQPLNFLMLLAGFVVQATTPLGQSPPGRTPERFAPHLVASDHSTPTISPDGREVVWSQRLNGSGHRRIFSSRFLLGAWSPPQVAAFADEEDGDCPVLAPDGSTLVFNSSRPLPDGSDTRRERLWFVTRVDTGWSDPRPVSDSVNGSHLHWQSSLDAEGNLFFGSEREGTLGRDDIFVAPRTADGWGTPERLPPPINTPSHESMPFVGADGSFLLFVRSDHSGTVPRYATGLLASFRNPDGGWTEPQRVPLGGVSHADASCPFVTRDGRYLLFLVLSRTEKAVYWVDAAVLKELDGTD